MDIKIDYRALSKVYEGLGSLSAEALDGIEALVREYVTEIMLPMAVMLAPKKTGRLADHIVGGVSRGDLSVRGVVGAKGVAYAHLIEHGFKGTEAVAEYSRTVKSVFGRALTASQTIRAHARTLDFTAEGYLQPVLDEVWPQFEEAVQASVLKTAQLRLQESTP